jgi:hypothetical protein
MVMASDGQKQARSNTELGWGGARQKKWQVQGKRAVVHIEPGAYEFVVQLAQLCRRGSMEMCSHIFAAGLESLSGFSIKELSREEFQITVKSADRPKTGVGRLTHEQVREVAKMFAIIPREDDEDDDGR